MLSKVGRKVEGRSGWRFAKKNPKKTPGVKEKDEVRQDKTQDERQDTQRLKIVVHEACS
jgi:hypothetical protein